MRTAPLAAAAALVPLLLAACETTTLFVGNPDNQTPEKLEWQSTEPLAAPSFELIWQRSRATLESMDYQIDDTRSRIDDRVMVTTWSMSLAPLRFEGTRRRAHLEFEQTDAKTWIVRCAVIRQRNADIDDPSNPAQANWEPAGPDPSRTGLLLYRVRAGLMNEPAK